MNQWDVTLVESIASVCHEANRAYCQTLGDFSQSPWDLAPDWARDSARNGVRMHLDNPDATPEKSHESWLAEKKATGWRWGPKKDPVKKEHPCFMSYQELPEDQKRKDWLFKAVVDALRPR